MTLSAPLLALLTGEIQPFGRGEESAIAKSPRNGPVVVGKLGLEGDQQADKRFHGGPEKALHLYPFDHYERWHRDAPDHPLLNSPGAFGENLSTLGLTEDQVCIGDTFRCGTALIQISQPRQPCWKQGDRMQWTTLPKLMVREGKAGWYFRVIEEGAAEAGERLELVERSLPEWTVRRVFMLLIAGGWKSEPEVLPELRDLELLDQGWRDIAAALIHG